MANTVIALRQSGATGNTPSLGVLANGELSLNYADGILYYKTAANTLGSIRTTQPAGLTTEIQFNDAGSFGSNSAFNFNKTTGTLNVSTLGINVDNRIDWPAAGFAQPSFTTRSAGQKITLYPAISGSLVDYSIGIDGGALWTTVPAATTDYNFKWYGGESQIASLSGAGIFTTISANIISTTASTSNTTGALLVAGGVGVKGNVYADAIYDSGVEILGFTQAAFDKANQTAQLAFTTVAANGTNLVADANNDTLTITAAVANGIFINADASSDTLDIGLKPSGVTAGTYGNSSTTITLTIDQFGRITSVSQTAVTYTETDPQALAFAIALG
jgi:hypothetical protein